MPQSRPPPHHLRKFTKEQKAELNRLLGDMKLDEQVAFLLSTIYSSYVGMKVSTEKTETEAPFRKHGQLQRQLRGSPRNNY